MKAELLSVLRDADDYVSGQDLCEKFGVSRTAVWKGINQLKEAGYEIEAVPNKGYKLLSVPDTLSEEELKSIRKTAWVGQEIFYYLSSIPPIPGRSSWRRKITLPERLWSPDSRMQAEAEEEGALSPRREPAFL